MGLDFFGLCRTNSPELMGWYNREQENWDADKQVRLSEFVSHIETNARIGTNRKPDDCLAIVRSGALLNRHALAKPPYSIQKKVDDWSKMRTLFEDHFEQGDGFIYASLNAGNCGSPHWGEYCFIWKQGLRGEYSIGYLRGDSLQFYCTPTTVDLDSIKADCADNGGKAHLAAKKHHEDLPQDTAEAWNNHICNKICYIECIFSNGTGEISLEYVEEVRLPQSRLTEYEENSFSILLESAEGSAGEDDFLAKIEAFAEIKDRLSTMHIPVRGV